MRSAVVRRVVLSFCFSLILAGSVPLASRVIYHVAAHVELARLNEERGTSSTFDQDTLSPANWQKSQELLDAVREAHLAAARKTQEQPTKAQLASTGSL